MRSSRRRSSRCSPSAGREHRTLTAAGITSGDSPGGDAPCPRRARLPGHPLARQALRDIDRQPAESCLGMNCSFEHAYTWGAAEVIFVVGAQKLVADLDAARERLQEHSL